MLILIRIEPREVVCWVGLPFIIGAISWPFSLRTISWPFSLKLFSFKGYDLTRALYHLACDHLTRDQQWPQFWRLINSKKNGRRWQCCSRWWHLKLMLKYQPHPNGAEAVSHIAADCFCVSWMKNSVSRFFRWVTKLLTYRPTFTAASTHFVCL